MTAKNYKDTLNLPRTDFPMKANLATREPELLKKWDEAQLYQQVQQSRKDKELFVLHDGPPFANGDVHMGTALNKILKDFVVKSQTMLGKRAPYVPGWDCHGLPIEYKVVKESRDLSPLEVRKRCDAFARKYVDLQREQFKRLGVLGDWEHPYLTLDPKYEAEILRAFAVFVEKGLVYQSKKPVFWSTGAQTALAEAEVEYQERDDTAVYVKFPIASGELKGKASIAIWTTTPWTLPANLAIAVNPKEKYWAATFELEPGHREVLVLAEARASDFLQQIGKTWPDVKLIHYGYQHGDFGTSFPGRKLAGITAQHPFLQHKVPVLPADFVTMDSGTGAVHIAPGHGEDDYKLGREHGLISFSPVDDHGRFTEKAEMPELTGKYVFDANADIIRILRDRGMLLGEQKFHHSYPYCWRSKTPIIFRAVDQFFIHIDALRGQALAAIHNEVKWIPAWGENRIAGTVESRPDWVISRQRSWGVPLPVFFSWIGVPLLNPVVIRRLADLVEEHGSNIWFEKDDEALRTLIGLPDLLPADSKKGTDTIDVWIDSGVSHKAVLQTRPELHSGDIFEPEDLQEVGVELPFRPADMYLEATDQHRGWFQSSLLTSVALNNHAPYRTCVTHGFVVDVDGKKISKSSTYDKPMDAGHFVNKHGADLVRLWASSINYTDDVPFSEEMFTRLGDAYRRIRNTLRILLGNLYDFDPETKDVGLTLIDRWILNRLAEISVTCQTAYAEFEFHKVYHTLNQFCAVDLSSLYVDMTKDRMYCDAPDSTRRRATQFVMQKTLNALCRWLAPILAFTAEEVWSYGVGRSSVHLEHFPDNLGTWRNPEVHNRMDEAINLRSTVMQAIEKARQEKLIGNALEAAVVLSSNSDVTSKLNKEELEEFFILSDLTIEQAKEPSATVTKTPYQKCARCWRHREYVGKSKTHPDLCDRCEKVVSG